MSPGKIHQRYGYSVDTAEGISLGVVGKSGRISYRHGEGDIVWVYRKAVAVSYTRRGVPETRGIYTGTNRGGATTACSVCILHGVLCCAVAFYYGFIKESRPLSHEASEKQNW